MALILKKVLRQIISVSIGLFLPNFHYDVGI